MEDKTFTVSEINSIINRKLKMDPNLKNILIKGEISNYKTYPSGHSYFTLKDESSQIPAVMFKGMKERFLKFKPENGMKVIVKGKIEVYIKDGKYQLYATKITEDGIGELHIAFEQLKKKLSKEGLFDNSHKKEIPKYPKRIGVVTAQTGAAIRDIITTIKRRYPICEILVFSTLVQGDNAAPQIVSQIKRAQDFDLDTLIVGRGGGSIEDLWPFNEEIVAREIYHCNIPVISAVGHEIDFTISDFTADKRAPTPTGAAVLAVPNITEVKNNVDQLSKRANKNIYDRINENKIKLDNISQKQIFKNPETIYEIKGMELDNLINKLHSVSKNIIYTNRTELMKLENSPVLKNPKRIYEIKGMGLNNLINKLNSVSKNIIYTNRTELMKLENSYILKNPFEITKSKRESVLRNIEKLEILNPLDTLKRGYTLAKSNGKVVSSAKDVKSGDELDIEFNDGTVNTKVI